MFKLLQKPMFYQDVPTDSKGGDPGDQSHMLQNIPEGNLDLGALLDSQPDDKAATESAEAKTDDKPATKRRAKADKSEDSDQGAAENEELESEAKAEEEEQKEEKKDLSNDETKTLLEQAQASKKRLRADNDKLRETLADLQPKAQLLENLEGMLQHPEHAGEGLKIILETASKLYNGDIVKALAAAGWEAKPIEPASPVAGIKEALKTKVTDAEKIKSYGWNDDEVEMVAKMNSDLVDTILDGLGTVLAPIAGSKAKPETKTVTQSAASFESEYKEVIQDIQEDVPLFKCTEAEAKAAKAKYQGYSLEHAIRLEYADRIAGEKEKQNAHVKVKPMVTSNGKSLGTSVMDPDRVAKGPISLSEALDSFETLN